MQDEKDLIKGFVEFERRRGIKRLNKPHYDLLPFFAYLDSLGITCDQVEHQEAQGYQTYLVTLEKEDGHPYYATISIAGLVSMVKRFYNYLEAAGKVFTNPFIGIKNIKTGSPLPRNIPDEDGVAQLLDHFGRFWEQSSKQPSARKRRLTYYKIHVIAELMYSTGLRVAEVAGLEEKDIDFERGIIKIIGKGDKPRPAYLNEYAASVLRLYVDEMKELLTAGRKSQNLFGYSSSASLSLTLNNHLNQAGRELGIGPFTSHNFRHALGFHLLRRGADLRYITQILGHENMTTTTIYTKVLKEDLKNELDQHHPRHFAQRQARNQD